MLILFLLINVVNSSKFKMTLKIFYDLASQPSRALLIFLKFNNIPYESKVIALRKGEHLTPEFAKINPFKKVPVIDDNGFILTESIAIIRYLSSTYNVEDKWYPKDVKQQAKVDEYLEWQHLNTRLFGSMVFRERVITPLMTGQSVNEVKLQFYKKNFIKVLGDIENSFLKNRSYLCGDSISVADIFCACEIEQALAIGFDPFSRAPKVKQWLDTVRGELEPYYSEMHEIIKRFEISISKGKL